MSTYTIGEPLSEGCLIVSIYEGEKHVAFVQGDTPEEATARARQFVNAAAAIDACKTYHMAMRQEDGPTEAQWEFIREKVEAVVKAVKGGR